jgi:AcrR family transcriptional regulator
MKKMTNIPKMFDDLPESRKDHIIHSASKLFLKQGYDRTSIRDVARECGIAMGTLYHYIGTKENLLRMVVEYHNHINNMGIEKIESSIKDCTPMEALMTAIRTLLEGIEEHKKIFVFVFTEAKLMPHHIREMILDSEIKIISVFEKILVDGCNQKLFQLKNSGMMAHHIVSMIEMWGVKWWYLRERATVDEFNSSLINFILPAVHGADGGSIKHK